MKDRLYFLSQATSQPAKCTIYHLRLSLFSATFFEEGFPDHLPPWREIDFLPV